MVMQGAVADFEEAAGIRPLKAFAQECLGKCLRALNHPAEASTALEEAAEIMVSLRFRNFNSWLIKGKLHLAMFASLRKSRWCSIE